MPTVAPRAEECSRVLAQRAIPDLIVILNADDEVSAIDWADLGTLPPVVEWTEAAVVHEHAVEGLCEMFGVTEILIVTVALTRQQRVDAVMKIVAPNAVEAVSALVGRVNKPYIVLVGFGDDVHDPVLHCATSKHGRLYVGKDVARRKIVDRLHGVEPQPVDVKIADPHVALSITNCRTESLYGPS